MSTESFKRSFIANQITLEIGIHSQKHDGYAQRSLINIQYILYRRRRYALTIIIRESPSRGLGCAMFGVFKRYP